MLKLVLPKGSLEKATLELFEAADLGVTRSSDVDYKATIDDDIRLSYGATEAKVPDIVDCIVDGTETGRALRAAGLKIIETIVESYTELIANPSSYNDP